MVLEFHCDFRRALFGPLHKEREADGGKAGIGGDEIVELGRDSNDQRPDYRSWERSECVRNSRIL
ncbi:hypothetical protein CC79DRAFT_1335808, partial [Sarocladium strictum]